MYDPLIGRWLQVDPMRQFSSSYAMMGNYPHATDPTGGFCDDCPNAKTSNVGDQIAFDTDGPHAGAVYEFVDPSMGQDGWVRISGGDLEEVTVTYRTPTMLLRGLKNFGHAAADYDQRTNFSERLALSAHKMLPSSAVESILIMSTGEDFQGQQHTDFKGRVLNPAADVVATVFPVFKGANLSNSLLNGGAKVVGYYDLGGDIVEVIQINQEQVNQIMSHYPDLTQVGLGFR